MIVVWGEIGLLIQVVARWEQSEADQNSFGGRRFGAEDGILGTLGARIRTGDSGASTPVRSE